MKKLAPARSATANVLDALRSAIISGDLTPGALYSIQTLADQLDVSRTPVREALIQLQAQKMVRFERNRGVRILRTTLVDLEEIFTLRILLEVPATYRAATRVTSEDLDRLEQELEKMRKAAEREDEPALIEHDRKFHSIIMTTASNQRLAEIVSGLRDLVLGRGASTANQSRTLADIVNEHAPILDHLQTGNAAQAAEFMRAHIKHTAELLVTQISGGTARSEELLLWAAENS